MDKIYSFNKMNFKSKNHIIFICDKIQNNFPKISIHAPEESILNRFSYDIGF